MNVESALSDRIRPAVESDIDECMSFAMPLFAVRFPHMQYDMVRQWARATLNARDGVIFRSDHGVGAAALTATVFEPFPICTELFVATASTASPFEHIGIYRALLSWGQISGAKKFRFGNGNGADIAPIAKRLGAKLYETIYEIEV